ncbi:MAG: CPBP family glutamic-type intramembrane protease, partial [Bacteroidota bacterium]
MKQSASVKEIIFIVLAIAFIFFFPQFGFIPIPFGYAILITIGIWLFLKRTNERFSDLGFSFKRFEWKSIFVGAATAALAFAFLQYLFFPLLEKIIHLPKANLEDFKQVRHHLGKYLFFVLMGFLAGGFYEELAFHAFIFSRLEKIVPAKNKVLFSFILTSVIFGLYHFQLGTGGVINAFIAGGVYHALIIKYNRNLWYGFFAHGFFDAIALHISILDTGKQQILSFLEQVPDPEVPVLSVIDLGIIRDVIFHSESNVEIVITPTYSGCPAMDVISMEIKMILLEHGFKKVTVTSILSPAWTTDWMTETGKEKLK